MSFATAPKSRYSDEEIAAYMASEQGRADKAKAFASYYAEREAEDAAGLG